MLGYATDAIASPRDVLAGLMDAFQFDARESGGVLQFFAKGNVRSEALSDADLVVDGDGDPGYSFTRVSDTDLPGAVRITYADPFRAYAVAGTEARKAVGTSQNVAQVATAAALDGAYAADVAATILQQTWAARETGAIKLPPSRLALEAGDAVTVRVDGVTLPFRIKSVETGTYRSFDLVGFDASLLVVGSPPVPSAGPPRTGAFGPPIVEFMELPPVTGQEPELWAPRIAAYARPWCTHQLRSRLRAENPCLPGKYRDFVRKRISSPTEWDHKMMLLEWLSTKIHDRRTGNNSHYFRD